MQAKYENQMNVASFNLRDIQTPMVGKRNKKVRELDNESSDQENSTFDSFDEKRLKESDFDDESTSKTEKSNFALGTFVFSKNI